MCAKLILLPNLLATSADKAASLPPCVDAVVSNLDGLIAESEKGGRHFLMRHTPHFRDIPIELLSEHKEEVDPLIDLMTGETTWGLVSDAGMPCLADPGARLVTRARKRGITIEAIPGPTSILLALALSGLPAQSFFFHGYPPKKPDERAIWIDSLSSDTTHLAIEAPYRNDHLFRALIDHLPETAHLGYAANLTAPDQIVDLRTVGEWRLAIPTIGKVPAIFMVRRARQRPSRKKGGPASKGRRAPHQARRGHRRRDS